MLNEIFKNKNKLASAQEVKEVICCLKKAINTPPLVEGTDAYELFQTFDPGAIIENRHGGDLITYAELKQIRCCFNNFLNQMLLL